MLEDIFRVLLKLPPSQRRNQKDLLHFREELAPWMQQLIPWEVENEIDLLSLNQEAKWTKHAFDKMLKGRLFSIYHETMLVFAYKSYGKNNPHSLLWVRSKKHEWIYKHRKKESELYIDGEFVGKINAKGMLYGGTRNRLLARRNRISADQWALVIWDRTVAHLLDPKRIDRVNPRAFEILSKFGDKELLLMLAISMEPVVKRLNKIN